MAKKKKEIRKHSCGKPLKGVSIYPNEVQDYQLVMVVDEHGDQVLENVPYSTADLDLGTADMYKLETLLAAGIQPASIHTSNNNKIATHEKIMTSIENFDEVFEREFGNIENNTQTTEIND